MKKNLLSISVLILGFLPLASFGNVQDPLCHPFKSDRLIVCLTFLKDGPNVYTDSPFVLRTYDASSDEQVKPGGVFSASTEMTGMDHRQPPTRVSESHGEFAFTRVIFSMAGEWKILVTYKEAGFADEIQIFKIQVGKAEGNPPPHGQH